MTTDEDESSKPKADQHTKFLVFDTCPKHGNRYPHGEKCPKCEAEKARSEKGKNSK